MAIPVPLAPSITAARNFDAPINSQPSYLCTPPKEGLRTVSMQFTFTQTFSWLVDLTGGSPNPPLSQICALWIDMALLFNDLYIYVPDSGQGFLVPSGGAQLCPIISNLKIPKFYVILAPDNFIGATDLTLTNQSVVNIIAMNQFVPFVNTATAIRTIGYGYGDGYAAVPNFVMDAIFSTNNAIAGGTGVATFTLLNHQRWFLKGVEINIVGNTTDGSTTLFTATLYDGTVAFMQKNFLLTAGINMLSLFDRQDINYQSIGGGTLTIQITVGAPGIVAANVSANIYGGTLVL